MTQVLYNMSLYLQ